MIQLVVETKKRTPELQEQVNLLSVAQLENLAETLLDFSNEADLVTWLDENSNQLD